MSTPGVPAKPLYSALAEMEQSISGAKEALDAAFLKRTPKAVANHVNSLVQVFLVKLRTLERDCPIYSAELARDKKRITTAKAFEALLPAIQEMITAAQMLSWTFDQLVLPSRRSLTQQQKAMKDALLPFATATSDLLFVIGNIKSKRPDTYPMEKRQGEVRADLKRAQ